MTEAEKLAALIEDVELLRSTLEDKAFSRAFKGMAAASLAGKIVAALPTLRAAHAALSQ